VRWLCGTLVLVLCALAGAGCAGDSASRDDVFTAVRAALKDAEKSGRAVTFPYAMGTTKVDARVLTMSDVELAVSIQGGQSSLKLSKLTDAEVYALGAGALPESAGKHTLLALFCAGAKLDEQLAKELARLEALGQPLASISDGLAQKAKQRQTEAREQQAAQAFERLKPLLRKDGVEKEAAAQLRTLMRQFADTDFSRNHQEEWAGLLEALAAGPSAGAILNIPTVDKPIDVNWGQDKRINQLLASNTCLDEAAIVWFGRVPPWKEDGPGAYDNLVEVRTYYEPAGLYVCFSVVDCGPVKLRDGKGAPDKLHILVNSSNNAGERPGPDDRLFVVPCGSHYPWEKQGHRESYRGGGAGWEKWEPPAPAAAPHAGEDGKAWAWKHHTFYFFCGGEENPYNGYCGAIWISWDALGLKPSEETRFRIAFMVEDHDPSMPADLYSVAPPAKDEPKPLERKDEKPRDDKAAVARRMAGLPDLPQKKEDAKPGVSAPGPRRLLPPPVPDPHARLEEVTETKDGKEQKRMAVRYPFDGTHPPWRKWDPMTRTIWHVWPPHADSARPKTWATAQFRKNEIVKLTGADVKGDVIDGPQSVESTWTGWGNDVPHHAAAGNPDLMVHPELYTLHMRDFGLKSFVRIKLSKLKGVPRRAFIKLPCWSGDGGDTGPSLLSWFLVEGEWWPETLTQSHPFQPIPIYNSVYKTWVDKGTDAVFEVTDVLKEALRRKRTTLDMALYGPDTDMDTGKYFRKAQLQLVVQY